MTPGGLPWRLNLASYDAGTGMSRGTISHLRLAFSYANCTAVAAGESATSGGQVAVSYASRTGTLTLLPGGSSLHWYRVNKCAGLINDGDHASLTASYAVTPKQIITSP